MLLPWEYGVRNLLRRPLRTFLTLGALSTVMTLVFVVVGFIRGLEKSLAVSGDSDVALVYSVNSAENIENSSIAASVPSLLSASIDGIRRRFGILHVSPEIFMGTRIQSGGKPAGLGLVRGVTTAAPLVRRTVQLTDGDWPARGQVMVGRLAAAKLGCPEEELATGQNVVFEGQTWKIAGHFSARGSAFESEIWCSLPELQTACKRQDLGLVAVLMNPGTPLSELDLFCKERTDLELAAASEVAYYATLQKHYRPVRILAWLVVVLVSGAGLFAGMNLMYGSVAGRVREIATLRAIGFRRRAILASVMQEGLLLAAAGSLAAGAVSLTQLNGSSVRFTMGAFSLQIDSFSILAGCSVGLLLGILGSLPPAIAALRAEVAAGLKAV